MKNQNKLSYLNKFVNKSEIDINTYNQTETNRSNWDIGLFQIDSSKIQTKVNLTKNNKKSNSNNKINNKNLNNYESNQSKFLNTEQSNKEKLGIIKKIKLNKSSQKSNISLEKYKIKNITYRHNSSRGENNENNNFKSSHRVDISERSKVLDEYLNEKFKQKLLSKKWYNNYKPNSNDNSMLEEKNNVNIYIESDKSLLINKQKRILYEKSKILTFQLKDVFSTIENENTHNKINLVKNFYYQTKYTDAIKRLKESSTQL